MLNAQTSRALFIDSLYQQALNHIDSSWSITKNEEGIQLKLIDSFVVSTFISPFRGNVFVENPKDSIIINLTVKNGWSFDKYVQQSLTNHLIIQPALAKYLAYYDLINWDCGKCFRADVIENVVEFLRSTHYTFYYNNLQRIFSQTELQSFAELVEIPSFLYADFGIYLRMSYSFRNQFIMPSKVNNKVHTALESLSFLVLGSKELLDGEPKYRGAFFDAISRKDSIAESRFTYSITDSFKVLLPSLGEVKRCFITKFYFIEKPKNKAAVWYRRIYNYDNILLAEGRVRLVSKKLKEPKDGHFALIGTWKYYEDGHKTPIILDYGNNQAIPFRKIVCDNISIW